MEKSEASRSLVFLPSTQVPSLRLQAIPRELLRLSENLFWRQKSPGEDLSICRFGSDPMRLGRVLLFGRSEKQFIGKVCEISDACRMICSAGNGGRQVFIERMPRKEWLGVAEVGVELVLIASILSKRACAYLSGRCRSVLS